MNRFQPSLDHRSPRQSRLIVAAALCSVGALAGFAGCTTGETADQTTTSSGSGGTAAATTGSNTSSAGTGGTDTVAATSTGASTSTGMSTSASTGTGGSEPAVPTCNFLCNTASDCTSSAGAYDASHYSCTNQTCVWKGCNSTQECIDAYKTPNWACSKLAGSTVATCNFLCNTASDCASSTGAYDASHYSCTNQTCVWKGCNSTQECIDTYKTPNWVCK